MTYYCHQCNMTNISPLCKGCNHFLTDDILLVDELLENPPLPDGHFGYGTAFAHWGDTMASLSITKHTLDAIGQKSCGMIYAGPDPKIPEMLKAQKWIHDVRFVQSPAYDRAYQTACQLVTGVQDWLPLIDDGTLPHYSEVWPTHHHQCFGRTYRVDPLRGAALPPTSKSWASKKFKEATKGAGRVFMVHPLSTWSYPQSGHWAYWKEAVDWLLDNTPHTYLLTGLVPVIERQDPRLIDLVGKVPSNLELLALLELCEGNIGTCNNLSLWGVIQNKPGIICGNGAIRNYVNYFRRFIDRPPNAYLDVHAPFEDFTRVAGEWLSGPAAYVEKARKAMDLRRRAHQMRIIQTDVPKIEPERYYRVLNGTVSGVKQDFGVGAMVESRDLSGGPEVYEQLGMIELVNNVLRPRTSDAHLGLRV